MFRKRGSWLASILLLVGLVCCGSVSGQDLPDPSRLWALVIGISGYTNAEPLRYAAQDALSLAEFLKSPRGGSFPEERVTTLTEDRASRFGVFSEIELLQERVQPGDTVVIFLAGHGFVNQRGIGYFIPSDGDLRMPAPTAIPFSALKELIELGLGNVQYRVLMTDLCHSGRIGPEKSELAKQIQNLINQNLLDVGTEAGGFLNLLASRPTEASWERDDLESGVFSHVLLRALNGEAGDPENPVLTSRQVVDYVLEWVPQFTANQQHPMVNRGFDPEKPLSYPALPGPEPEQEEGAAVTLILPAVDAYSRVEWLDPSTGATTVHLIDSGISRLQLGLLHPGSYEFRLSGPNIDPLAVPCEVAGEEVVLDLSRPRATGRFPDTLGRFATLGFPGAGLLSTLVQSPQPASRPSASLLLRLPPETRVFLEEQLVFDRVADGYVQLAGLAPGYHRLYLEPSPNREYRYRIELLPGLQTLDWRTGQLRPLSEAPSLPEVEVIPSGIPQQFHEPLRSFRESLWQDYLVGNDGRSALERLSGLEAAGLPQAELPRLRRQLLVAMGDRAQRIVLRYLKGGDIRWIPEVFEEGAALISEVRRGLNPNPILESQEAFFRGRALLEREDFQQASAELRRAIALDPEASHALNGLGLALWRQQRLLEAVGPLEQALRLSPGWNYPRVTLALVRLELREYPEAERLFLEALRVDPEDSTALHGLGQLEALGGDWEEAERLYRAAVDFNPGNAYACHSLARLYLDLFRFEEAEELLLLAIRLEPEEVEFKLTLAELFRLAGRLQEADGVYDALLAASPNASQVLMAQAEHLGRSGRFDQAVPFLEAAIASGREESGLLVRAGLFWMERDSRKAREYLRQAAESGPARTYAYYNLAVLLAEEGKLDAALRELGRSVEADARYVPPRLLVGRILEAEGRDRESLEVLRESRNLAFEPEQLQQIEEALERIESRLVSARVEQIQKAIARGRVTEAWKGIASALIEFSASSELKNLTLDFLLGPGRSVQLTELPQAPLKEVLESQFWLSLREAEGLWSTNRREIALESFQGALGRLGSGEPVLSTAFNLGNPDHSIHATVTRWSRRAMEVGAFDDALAIMQLALEKRIFAPVPGVEPLTIDSLMLPAGVLDPKDFSDYEVARHPDPQAHRVLALALAGTGESLEDVNSLLPALEESGADFELRYSIARILRRTGRSFEARSFLGEAVKGIAGSSETKAPAGFSEAVLLFVDLCLDQGDSTSAYRVLEEAVAAFPDEAALRERLIELRGRRR